MKNEKVDYTGVYIVKIDKLEKEIERLNNIINKAIEYIEKNVWSCYILDDEKELIETDSEELLEILKGSDKEW